jgi:hypothetical protein
MHVPLVAIAVVVTIPYPVQQVVGSVQMSASDISTAQVGCLPTRLLQCFEKFLSKRYTMLPEISTAAPFARYPMFDRIAAVQHFRASLPFHLQERGAKPWPSPAPSRLQLHRQRRS